jgi:SAM-dependent methyltransferase
MSTAARDPSPGAGATGERYDALWREVYGDMQDVGPVHRHMRRLLKRLLSGLEYRDSLDVGCGAGHNLDLIAGGRPLTTVSGADVSAEAIGLARARSECEFFQLDIEREAIARQWDLVFSALVLEHLDDDVAALRHMRAMTKRHLVLATVAGAFERYRRWEHQVGHVRNYARGELERKLEAEGMTVRRALYWGFPFYSPLMRTIQNGWRAEPSFSPVTQALARGLYALYHLNSTRRGDLLIVHATTPGA